MLAERFVPVARDPLVELFVRSTTAPAERTLLVIHGGPDWDHSYLIQPLAELGGDHRVVWPDLRGCGRSTRGLPVTAYTPDLVVADLLALLDALGVPRANVLGFSYGGLLAQRLAVAAPDRVHRLVLASTSVPPVPADAFAGWAERDRRREAEAKVWADATLTGPAFARAAAFASAAANVWRPESLPGYREILAGIRFSGEWLRTMRSGGLPPARVDGAAERLAGTGVPILLLHGRQDMTFPAVLVEPALRSLPAARAVVLDDAGHMAHIDQPRAWLAAIRDFLA